MSRPETNYAFPSLPSAWVAVDFNSLEDYLA